MDFSAKHQEFEQLKGKVERLEGTLTTLAGKREWTPKTYFWVYHSASGMLLGVVGAAVALLANVVLAPMAGKHPLELIRVYLTFPLGDQALALTDAVGAVPAIRDGMILTFGCCLYLVTGMLLGMPTRAAIARWAPHDIPINRVIVGSATALAIWLVGFYGILSWLQPLLCGGNWITSGDHLPWWIAAVTHAVFGGTIALLSPLTKFLPYPPPEIWDALTDAPFEEPPLSPGG